MGSATSEMCAGVSPTYCTKYSLLLQVGGLHDVYHFELIGPERVSLRTDLPYTGRNNDIVSDPEVSVVLCIIAIVIANAYDTGWIC